MSRRTVLALGARLLMILAANGCATTQLDRHGTTQRQLSARIAFLAAALDSLEMENDSLRTHVSRIEADLLDRDEQVRALRLELQRLKEIDLRPRPRP